MQIVKLNLSNMRVFDKLSCEFTKKVNLIFGENGKGKTTILEAIHILSISKSFRSGLKQNIVKKGKNYLSLSSEILADNDTKTSLSHNFVDGSKRIKINEKRIEQLSDLIGVFPVVIMSPEDSDIISGPPQSGRNYINKLFSIIDKQYFEYLRCYKKTLKQKQEALFRKDAKQLEIWNHQMAIYGTKLWKEKKSYMNSLAIQFDKAWQDIEKNTDAKIQLKSPFITNNKEFVTKLKDIEKEETEKQRTLLGPHRDRLQFLYDNNSLKDFGSQGEKKIVLSALKLAEARFIEEHTNKSPVVLLDDLFAKLDKNRSMAILNFISNHNQVFITTTDSQAGKLIASKNKNITFFHLDGELKCYEA